MKKLPYKHQQEGVVLLLFMLVLLTAGISAYLYNANNKHTELTSALEVSKEMAEAKELLLSYASSFDDLYQANQWGPGRLFCTDSNNNGQQGSATPSTCDDITGRLPQFITLPVGPSRFEVNDTYSGIDQQFWYRVSSNYSIANTGSVLNSTTPGLLSLDGRADYVAVILAPGEAFSSQDRSDSLALTSPIHHLEHSNQAGSGSSSNFISSYSLDPSSFNDKVLGITRLEVMDRAVPKVGKLVSDYLQGRYELMGFWPTNTGGLIQAMNFANHPTYSGLVPDWFINDQWRNNGVINYVDYNVTTTTITYRFSGCNIEFSHTRDVGFSQNGHRCN